MRIMVDELEMVCCVYLEFVFCDYYCFFGEIEEN